VQRYTKHKNSKLLEKGLVDEMVIADLKVQSMLIFVLSIELLSFDEFGLLSVLGTVR
jgi:hypothetical protein